MRRKLLWLRSSMQIYLSPHASWRLRPAGVWCLHTPGVLVCARLNFLVFIHLLMPTTPFGDQKPAGVCAFAIVAS